MRQKQRCADMLTQVEQVAVRQSRQRIFVKTGLRFCAVPSDVKSVAIDRQFRLQSLLALRNQRMAGVNHNFRQGPRGVQLCSKTAHQMRRVKRACI